MVGHADGTGTGRQCPTSWRLLAASSVVLVAGGGLLAIRWALERGIADIRPATANVYWVLLTRYEPRFFLLLALATAAAAILLRQSDADPLARRPQGGTNHVSAIVVLSLAVLAVTYWGHASILHSLDLSMDEFGSGFQARIFATGRLRASVPEEWRPFARPLTPLWISLDSSSYEWASQYLPGFAAIRAMFLVAGIERAANPVLAAGTVLAVFAAARRLWPTEPRHALAAAALLGVTPQFLVTSMSWYSMPAHLFLNSVWLAAFLSPRRAVVATAPWIGGVALLLHQPVPHALFAAPFLLRLLRERRFRQLAHFGAAYALAASAGLAWIRFTQPPGASGFQTHLSLPESMASLALHFANAALVLSWQSPFVPFLLGVAVVGMRRLGAVERDLLGGLVLSFSFYVFFPSDQGHGWGYRYTYNVLANVMLLSVSGLRLLVPDRLGRRAFLAATIFGLVVFLPARLLQCRQFVEPFARAHLASHVPGAAVVIVDPASSWYGNDLVRNDPFLRNEPKLMYSLFVTPEQRRELIRRHPDRVLVLSPKITASAGVPSWNVMRTQATDGRQLVEGGRLAPEEKAHSVDVVGFTATTTAPKDTVGVVVAGAARGKRSSIVLPGTDAPHGGLRCLRPTTSARLG